MLQHPMGQNNQTTNTEIWHVYYNGLPVERQIMSEKEIQEMIDILMELGTERYTYFKYTILLSSKNNSKVNAFFEKVFDFTDKNRPLLLEIKNT